MPTRACRRRGASPPTPVSPSQSPPDVAATVPPPAAGARPPVPPPSASTLTWSAAVWRVFAAATAVKLLLIPAYRSTDYDVHVHWLALTRSLPLDQWYTDASSPWALDYPPLFALASRGLAALAAPVDGGSLVRLGGPPPSADAAVLFMRASVMAADVVLAAGLSRLLTALVPARRVGAPTALAAAAAVLFHPGLLLVDHIHFQYNGLPLGVLLWALAFAVEGAPVSAAVAAACAFNLKHTLLPASLPLAAHLLTAGLRGDGVDGSLRGRAAHLGGIVFSGVDALLLPWVPFLVGEHGLAAAAPIFARLAPTGRGLLHSYWAANAWAVATAADVAACAAARSVATGRVGAAVTHALPAPVAAAVATAAATCAAAASGGAAAPTAGVVGVARPWALLPRLTPALSTAAVVVAAAPCLGALTAAGWGEGGGVAASARRLPGAVGAAGLAAFVFGWHVHEKAILLPSVALAVATAVTATRAEVADADANADADSDADAWDDGAPTAAAAAASTRAPPARARAECRAYVWVALAGHWALLPLLPGPAEAAVKLCAVFGYAAAVLPRLWALGGGGSGATVAVVAYTAGLLGVEAYAGVGGGHARLWGDRYPFVPLLLVSVYAAVGVGVAFATLLWQDLCGEEEEEGGGGGEASLANGGRVKED